MNEMFPLEHGAEACELMMSGKARFYSSVDEYS